MIDDKKSLLIYVQYAYSNVNTAFMLVPLKVSLPLYKSIRRPPDINAMIAVRLYVM